MLRCICKEKKRTLHETFYVFQTVFWKKKNKNTCNKYVNFYNSISKNFSMKIFIEKL